MEGLTIIMRYRVQLTKDERDELTALTRKGKHNSNIVINALILLNCDEGAYQSNRMTNEDIAQILHISDRKINNVKKRCVEEGLDVALKGRKNTRIYDKKADGDFEAHLVALCCSEPPEGFAKWSLRLLAEKAVELEYIDSVSHETVRRVLKKTNLNLGNPSNG